MRNSNPVDVASLLLQVISLQILLRDYNNSDLMRELQKQNSQYFEKIIEQNKEILSLLRKEENKWKMNY